ncbi:DUF3732 domain-containing protein [Pasteurella atlantica]|uniref:DUF3732 domain-containing protein n=2 Tax=Pasteurellaceae TaxID=712 RepID=A0ACC6HJ28_9PAST|nr:DUF3732 domain-containing protein [Pasteurella atlantica]MDP8050881.1 DUF3732 domain-containing protein [Pasteurella atlantica]MDP8101701.1 DUF3732 domain-containing protein [Pasteurella atlantica]MDP8104151.1 DUF3732 domain-containing protein [Pasteurella atlantica]MDP8147537.1 DUF3732 domain-containing protein [Pasteurella atlantica]
MNCYIKYIGVVDKNNNIHYVEFQRGVNVITGNSSTGKSAMIEIFDYCMGSSEFTIPSGVITENADIYFIVLSIKGTFLVLGRGQGNHKQFIKEEYEEPDINTLNKEYFEARYFITGFNVTLGHYFGLDINDIDEDLERLKYAQKKGRPSIRNVIPYLLQHQNLIANKHSLFYRFDQKEKREQTIDQFKIFAGFVTQEYFIIKQKLAESERKLKKFKIEEKYINEQQEFNAKKLKVLLDKYEAISGNKLFDRSAKAIILNSANYLKQLDNREVSIKENIDGSVQKLLLLKSENNKLLAEKRKLVYKYNNIDLSIAYAKQYNEELSNDSTSITANISSIKCPLCDEKSQSIIEEANQLENAINWLNTELKKTPYILDSFESDKNRIQREIEQIDRKLKDKKNEIDVLEKITENLSKNKSLEDQALKVKLKIENFLESFVDKENAELDKNIEKLQKSVNGLKRDLSTKFNINRKLKESEMYINDQMKEIGQYFDFEEYYKPINLKFSLESFDLWYEKEDTSKVFLRSMGSGANWLYSHLTLFLAIHKFFASRKEHSLVPQILFLDQPTQVYFPTAIKDTGDEFNAKNIKEKIGDIKTLDDDIKSVTNIFDQLVSYCKKTLEETGIEPQIIITDHADGLELSEADFNALVCDRRWRRGRGFINE